MRTLYRTEAELLIASQYGALVSMRDRGEIETTLHALETQLDFKRLQLAGAIDRRSEGEDATLEKPAT